MKYIIFIGCMFFLLVSPNALSAGNVAAGDINLLLFYKGHTGLLIKHQYPSDPDDCGRQDYYILPDNHPHFSQIYAMILAAQTSGKKVSFKVDGCLQGLPAIVNAGLEKQ